uniref:Mitochondrial import inner membrane translocase subunit TIM44 n=1 Tax=Cricetulus griseus TaxID=10029 RepID=A0A8C2MZT9_CRIGR
MAAAALRSGWCRCPRRCLGSRVQFLSSHNPPQGSSYQISRPGGELTLTKSYSSGNRKGFLSGLLDNIKQELAKNKEMKESIKKFRDEAKKLEESDALQEARRKYVSTSIPSLSPGPGLLGKVAWSQAWGPAVHSSHCLLPREALGVVLHKDSKWYQQWKDFKDNNVVFNRFFEMKMKYDESDNVLIRASRALTDKVTDLLGGLFSKTEMSEVLTEILRVDPTFDKDRFLRQCESDIIPNILEAMISGELDILKDWCYEATYSQLAHPIQQAKALGLQFHSRILDISNVDLAMGKMMEQGPVLIVTFQAQLVMVIKNPKGEVVEGDPDKVLRMLYVWALCRDQEELNPYAAWRLLDISASSTEQIL